MTTTKTPSSGTPSFAPELGPMPEPVAVDPPADPWLGTPSSLEPDSATGSSEDTQGAPDLPLTARAKVTTAVEDFKPIAEQVIALVHETVDSEIQLALAGVRIALDLLARADSIEHEETLDADRTTVDPAAVSRYHLRQALHHLEQVGALR